jgi:hypothetical protein
VQIFNTKYAVFFFGKKKQKSRSMLSIFFPKPTIQGISH